jgi:DNA-binding response OmpR family regulator
MTVPLRILVVDDQDDIREMARLVLVDGGYEVATAPSGEAALRLARESGFDLMLLDINMPGLDGWSTLRLVRADEALDELPVAMFSSLQDGAVDYITKPFGVDELLSRVERILSAHGRGSNAVPTASPR